MPQLKCLTFIIIFISIRFTCYSQGKITHHYQFKRCSFRTINFEQGLANNETGSVLTDRSGFTWVSTKTGMQRFNGYVMENINPVVNRDTIVIDYPVIFFPLQNGNIWISYEQGILEYDAYHNIFRKIIDLPLYKKGFLPVIPVLQKPDGIWCAYFKKGIVVYNENKLVSPSFANAEKGFVDSFLQTGNYLAVKPTAVNGNDIFLSYKTRILHINTTALQTDHLQKEFPLIFGMACTKNKLYIISAAGFTCANVSSGNIYSHTAFNEITNEPVLSAQVNVVNDNQLLVSVNRHLYEFDTACNYQKEFTSLIGDPVVTTGYIRFIYADRFKRIWLMTNDDIKLVQNVEIPFSHYIYPNAKSNFVKCIYYDEQKHLLLAGCFNGGVQLYDTSGNRLWEKPLFADKVKDVMVIEKLSADDFLVETYLGGWFILNVPSKKIIPFPVPGGIEKTLHSNAVAWTNNIQRISDSVVLIATKTNIYNCVFKNTVLRSATPLLPFLTDPNAQYDCFVYTANQSVWAGTLGGQISLEDKNGDLKHFTIPGNYGIRCFVEDVAHNIWAGTDKGLYVYNGKGELIKKIKTETGLLNDCIYALLPVTGQPAVFASTNFGLSYVSVDGTIKNYTKELGLQGNEFNNGAACKTAEGKFYFGGVNGITSFYPGSLSTVKDTPVLNITRLMINDSVYKTDTGIWNEDSILLKYNQNHIQLDIAANGLLNTGEYIYTYRLKNFEESWQTTHQPTAIRYTLDPGSYVLEINCSPYLSSNTVFTKKIFIIISPPWWHTWWFRLLYSVCLVLLIVFIVWQYNRRQFRKKIRALQVKQEVQQERERISRDLHDNLGAYVAAIVANVSRIQETTDTPASPAIIELQNNSQSIVTQLQDTIWALNKEAIVLTAISDRFKIFLQKLRPSYPGIDISVKEMITNDTALSPAHALHLFSVMQEAVNNALRHSNCSNVIVMIESNADWIVSIADDGEGLSNTAKPNAGNGLRNMRQRCAEAGWKIEWITEKPQGTRLVINSSA